MKLDRVDFEILEILQNDGRVTNKALAERVGLAPSTCLERVRQLESDGVIVGYRAIVAPSRVGASLEGWAEIRLAEHSPEVLALFSSLLMRHAAIISAYHVAGSHDFLLYVVAKSAEEWKAFLASVTEEGVGIACARLSVVIDRLKHDAPIVLASPPLGLVSDAV